MMPHECPNLFCILICFEMFLFSFAYTCNKGCRLSAFWRLLTIVKAGKTCNYDDLAWVDCCDAIVATSFAKDNAITQRALFSVSTLANN